jgi:glucuronokinase
VLQAMKEFVSLTDQALEAIAAGDADRLASTINANFDLRHRICRLHPAHVEMVEAARRAGASAKYAGSGGAIVGTYTDEPMFARLTNALSALGCRVFRPQVTNRHSYPEWLDDAAST